MATADPSTSGSPADLAPRFVAAAVGVALVVLALWLWADRLTLPAARGGAAVAGSLAAGVAGQACFFYSVGTRSGPTAEVVRSLRWAAAVLAGVATTAAGALWVAAR